MPSDGYNYDEFRMKWFGDAFLDFEAPKIGEAAVDFAATTADGKAVRLGNFFGRPIVLETGSLSCPHAVYRVPLMNDVARRHPKAQFLLLYTREAHPGAGLPKLCDFDRKVENARRLRDEERDERIILVDDLEGTAHRRYGLLPNSVFVIDPGGRIAFRASWNDVNAVDEVLGRIEREQPLDGIVPKYKTPPLGLVFRTFRRAGWQSFRDFARELPKLLAENRRAPART